MLLLFLRLSLVPEGVHLAEGHILKRFAYADRVLLYVVEASDELGIGLVKRRIGINLVQTRGIDEGEEEVAKLFGRAFLVLLAYFSLQLGQFLAHLAPYVALVLPVEAYIASQSVVASGGAARQAVYDCHCQE